MILNGQDAGAVDQAVAVLAAGGLVAFPTETVYGLGADASSDAAVAGIFAFRHPKADAIAQQLKQKNIHIMAHAGRLRVAVHGYNTSTDIETFLRELKAALQDAGN